MMSKRIFFLLLTVVLVFGMFPTTGMAASQDAQNCEKLGILKGTDPQKGVDDAYLSLDTLRYQAVVIMARLLGMEDQIEKIPADASNFTDAENKSGYVKNVMAFAKAHPELGFIGYEDGSFHPEEQLNAQQIYKVLLVVLGYAENKDFTWNQVFSFAGAEGLSQLKNYGTITNSNLATALIEALKANMAAGDKTLAKNLVDLGIIDDKVIDNTGILDEPVPLAEQPAAVGGGGGGGGGGTGGGKDNTPTLLEAGTSYTAAFKKTNAPGEPVILTKVGNPTQKVEITSQSGDGTLCNYVSEILYYADDDNEYFIFTTTAINPASSIPKIEIASTNNLKSGGVSLYGFFIINSGNSPVEIGIHSDEIADISVGDSDLIIGGSSVASLIWDGDELTLLIFGAVEIGGIYNGEEIVVHESYVEDVVITTDINLTIDLSRLGVDDGIILNASAMSASTEITFIANGDIDGGNGSDMVYIGEDGETEGDLIYQLLLAGQGQATIERADNNFKLTSIKGGLFAGYFFINIYEYAESEGEGTYGVICAVQSQNPFNAEVKMVDQNDMEKTWHLANASIVSIYNADKSGSDIDITDLASFQSIYSTVVPNSALVGYKLNDDGEIIQFDMAYDAKVCVKSKIVLADQTSGRSYTIAKDVAVFFYKPNANPTYISAVSLADINFTDMQQKYRDGVAGQYILNSTGDKVVAILLPDLSGDDDREDVYGVINSVAWVKSGDDTIWRINALVDGFHVTLDATANAPVIDPRNAAPALYFLTKNESGKIKDAAKVASGDAEVLFFEAEAADTSPGDDSNSIIRLKSGYEIPVQSDVVVYKAVWDSAKSLYEYTASSGIASIEPNSLVWVYDTKDDKDGIATVVIWADRTDSEFK